MIYFFLDYIFLFSIPPLSPRCLTWAKTTFPRPSLPTHAYESPSHYYSWLLMRDGNIARALSYSLSLTLGSLSLFLSHNRKSAIFCGIKNGYGLCHINCNKLYEPVFSVFWLIRKRERERERERGRWGGITSSRSLFTSPWSVWQDWHRMHTRRKSSCFGSEVFLADLFNFL